jgi:hypothetical protein
MATPSRLDPRQVIMSQDGLKPSAKRTTMPEEGPDQADIDSRLIMVGPFQAARLGPLEAVPATRRQHAGYSWIYSLTPSDRAPHSDSPGQPKLPASHLHSCPTPLSPAITPRLSELPPNLTMKPEPRPPIYTGFRTPPVPPASITQALHICRTCVRKIVYNRVNLTLHSVSCQAADSGSLARRTRAERRC